jgi:ubiquinone/menaquinone biosynthesis C-methylase UbiE
LNTVIAEKGEFDRMVLGYRADGTALPFADSSFDGYVSNLLLMLIANPKK